MALTQVYKVPRKVHGGGEMKVTAQAKGFTLIELVAVAALASVMAYLSINLYQSRQERQLARSTKERMLLIRGKIEQYFLSHEQLPVALQGDQVPVQPQALDMEPHFRLDAWGNFFSYNHGGDLTDIQKDGLGGYAAIITSAGPDQRLRTASDNLVVHIDLTEQAAQITLNKLQVLQEKVQAYDAMFAGIDNDGDGLVDNTNTQGVSAECNATSFNTCPPSHSFVNDPSSGLPTLDRIEAAAVEGGFVYDCSGSLVENIVKFYGLRKGFPGGFAKDPWGNFFAWGYPGRIINRDGTRLEAQDRRYHTFYSMGPDTETEEDDIIY